MNQRSLQFVAIASAFFLFPILATHAEDETKKGKHSDEVKSLVQAALLAEINGTQEERSSFLDQAADLDSKEPLVHWQRGHLQAGKAWKPYADIVDQNRNSKALEEYRELRDASKPTFDSQMSLVNFCQKRKLDLQALSHWSAILELDPNHAEARKALGYEYVDNQWVTTSQLRKLARSSAMTAKAFSENSAAIEELSAGLQQGKITKELAVRKLKENGTVYCIPIWETYLSARSDLGANVVIETLATMPQAEASLSLARHAVWASKFGTKNAAIEALKTRDFRAFIPAMLSELQSPWVASRQIVTDGESRLTYRITAFSESRDRKALKVLDTNLFIQGDDDGEASKEAVIQANMESSRSDGARMGENRAIEKKNQSIFEALGKITGQDLKSPQEWWRWWDEYDEVYSVEEKPLDASYASRSATIESSSYSRLPTARYAIQSTSPATPVADSFTLRAPQTPTRVFQQQSSPFVDRVPVPKFDVPPHECLAAGTPVLTNRGPVSIERIRIGDLVASQHPVTGEVKMQPVLRTTVRPPERLLEIKLQSVSENSSPIRSTGGHPFWVAGQGWTRARDLEPGMRIHGLDHFSTVASVIVEEKPARTFNLIVHEFHSYFVGKEGILSHDNSHIQPITNRLPGMDEENAQAE